MNKRMIYLIRHGQYDTSDPDENGGSLTDLGHEQAKTVGATFADLSIQRVFASTMTRAIETAAAIAEELEVGLELTHLLREAIPSIPPRIAPHIMRMIHQNPRISYETIEEDRLRADEAYNQFFIPSPGDVIEHEVLVCHGNLIRYFVCRALEVSDETWSQLDINHCGITTISVSHEGLARLVSHNSLCHLPHDIRSS